MLLFKKKKPVNSREKRICENPCPPLIDAIEDHYEKIMCEEMRLSKNKESWDYPDAEEIHGVAVQILDTAGLGLVPRSYNSRYGNYTEHFAPESVGAHTNLMLAIVARIIRYEYGTILDGIGEYWFLEIYEAIQRHDQPEVATGDIPDNGDRNEDLKFQNELAYHRFFSKLSPKRDLGFEKSVMKILQEMNEKSTSLGRLLFAADKAAALIVTLYYDRVGVRLAMPENNPLASTRDQAEMKKCDYRIDGACYASEMWAIDYFKSRSLIDYDETGYITALIVMCTLLVNSNEWYRWREKDYNNH